MKRCVCCLGSFRSWQWIAGTLAVAVAAPAGALMTGIAGFSGQQLKAPETPLYCSNAGIGCHVSDSTTKAPLVRFEGPTQVDPGAPVTYTFIVTSQNPQAQHQAGVDISASAGTLSVQSEQQEQLCNINKACPRLTPIPASNADEITHIKPKENDGNGETSWQFSWTAPMTPGVYTLFGAGNSVDGLGTDTGDEAAITTLMITVSSLATPTPTPLPCAGDCNHDGMVSVNELVLAVNIALGALPVADCPAADTDGNNAVSVSELVAAVNRALNGC